MPNIIQGTRGLMAWDYLTDRRAMKCYEACWQAAHGLENQEIFASSDIGIYAAIEEKVV
jgi:hypothetical protein